MINDCEQPEKVKAAERKVEECEGYCSDARSGGGLGSDARVNHP